jgi:hypothetical protein
VSDVLSRMNGGELLAFFGLAGGLLVGAIAIIAGIWLEFRRAEFRARQAEVEAALKQDMLNRGMSADEIERVLSAGQKKAAKPSPHERVRAQRTAGSES